MELLVANSADAVDVRQARVVAASLRAAYAWSTRHKHPQAMQEICRMTGVVMEAHGPGRGPTSPMELVRLLHGSLSGLLTFTTEVDRCVADAVLLNDDGHLTDAAYGVAAEYARQPTLGIESSEWLPSWTRMRADEIEHQAFARMIEAGDPAGYVRARRFLIEHPAGQPEELSKALVDAGANCAALYEDLSPSRVYEVDGGRWWWACPVCKYPLEITSRTAECRYELHKAKYTVVPAQSPKARPRLQRIFENGPRKSPTAMPADGAKCVDAAVWRFIVVPGSTELRIHDELTKLGATVRLWPSLDAYDLDVTAGQAHLQLDVKEYSSVRRLIDHLRRSPPAADVLLPSSHDKAQLGPLRQALPNITFTTEADVRRRVREGLRRSP